jgi:hypothetical protein
MKSSMFAKAAAVAAIAVGSLAVGQAAQARTNVYFSVDVPAPVYVAPQPVYVAPRPAYVTPPEVVYQPVYSGRGDWRWREAQWRREEWRREQWRRHHQHGWDGHR